MAAWMLELDSASWRLYLDGVNPFAPVAIHQFADAELAGQPAIIREALTAHNYFGEPIMLAVGSNWCLATTLSVNRRHELRDRQTMLYRLEEWMPWEAEDSVVDYLASGNKALMVAVHKSPLGDF